MISNHILTYYYFNKMIITNLILHFDIFFNILEHNKYAKTHI